MRGRLWRALTVAGLLAGAPALAHAQSTLPLKGTLDETEDAPALSSRLAETGLEIKPLEPPPPPRKARVRADPYAPVGIGAGGLRLFPTIGVSGVYTSNVNSSPKKPEGDFGLQLRPSLRFESDWVRHSWTGNANGTFVHYAENDELDARAADVSHRLRLDVRRGTTAEISGRYALDQDGVGKSDVPATAKGLRTEHTLAGDLALTHGFGPMSGTLKGGLTGRIFEDVDLTGGGKEKNKDRNYVQPTLSLRLTYTDPPVLKPFIEAAYTPRYHTISRDRNGLQRDSQGLELTAGTSFAADPFWSGELGLTYLHRNYEDPLLDPVDSFGITGNLTWSPTELTRVVMTAGTSIAESTSASFAGNPTWTASVAATHGLRDNLDLSASAGIEVEDIGPVYDVTYDAGVALSWKLNPVVSWSAAYDVTWLDGGNGGRDYSEHRISTGLTLSR